MSIPGNRPLPGNKPLSGSKGRSVGVTLIEMLIVVSIIAAIASISFPALTAGLAGVRLASSAGSVASFLTSSMNNVDRREQPAAIVIDPKENRLAVYTAASKDTPQSTLEMPPGIFIEGKEGKEGDDPRRFLLFPGGSFPHISVILRSEKGGRRSIEIDPVTAVPKIQRIDGVR
ncbi:MAG: prepilin-type N-terminal cleavage/methylation domain-containing protein [Terriglobia bacterium]